MNPVPFVSQRSLRRNMIYMYLFPCPFNGIYGSLCLPTNLEKIKKHVPKGLKIDGDGGQ